MLRALIDAVSAVSGRNRCEPGHQPKRTGPTTSLMVRTHRYWNWNRTACPSPSCRIVLCPHPEELRGAGGAVCKGGPHGDAVEFAAVLQGKVPVRARVCTHGVMGVCGTVGDGLDVRAWAAGRIAEKSPAVLWGGLSPHLPYTRHARGVSPCRGEHRERARRLSSLSLSHSRPSLLILTPHSGGSAASCAGGAPPPSRPPT